MRFLKLRIAWSVACDIAGLLLIMLWLRSYSGNDYLCWMQPSMLLGILPGEASTDPGCSEQGVIWLRWEGAPDIANGHLHFERLEIIRTDDDIANNIVGVEYQELWFGKKLFAIRHRTLITLAALFAAMPWMCWRFSPLC
jgi:hypothetical protein